MPRASEAPYRRDCCRAFGLTESAPSAGYSGLRRQATWLLAAKVIGFACNLALPLMLARALSPREYGLFKQAFLSVTTLLNVLPLGVAMSAFYYLARLPERRGQTVWNIVLFQSFAATLGALALALCPGLWHFFFPGSPELAARGGTIGLLLWLSMFGALLEILATANQEVKLSTAFIIGSQAGKSLLMAAAAVWRPNLDTLLSAGLTQAALETAVLFWYLRRTFPGYWRSLDLSFFGGQIRYAVPLGLAGLIYVAQTDLANYFVGWRYGPAAYAVYANGNFQIPLIGLVRDSLSGILITRMSALEARGEARAIAALGDAVSRRLVLLYFPASAFFYYYAGELIRLAYGAQYGDSVSVFRVAILAFPMQAFIYDPVLRAYSEQRYFLLRLRLVTLLALAGALALASRQGTLEAAMTAVVCVHIVERVVLLYKVRVILGVDTWAGTRDLAMHSAKTAFLSLSLLLVLELFQGAFGTWPGWARLAAGAAVFGALFLIVGLVSGLISRDFLRWKQEV